MKVLPPLQTLFWYRTPFFLLSESHILFYFILIFNVIFMGVLFYVTLFFQILCYVIFCYFFIGFHCHKVHYWLAFNMISTRSQASKSPGYGGVCGTPVE